MNCILHETELAESGGNTSRISSIWKRNTMVNMWPNNGEHLGFRKGSRFLTSSINSRSVLQPSHGACGGESRHFEDDG